MFTLYFLESKKKVCYDQDISFFLSDRLPVSLLCLGQVTSHATKENLGSYVGTLRYLLYLCLAVTYIVVLLEKCAAE